MGNKILLFEDENHCNLKPLSSTRPVHSLRCGIYTISEKIEKWFPLYQIYLHQRESLKGVVEIKGQRQIFDNQNFEDDYLIINGRILADENLKLLVDDLSCRKVYQIIMAETGVLLAGYLPATVNFSDILQGKYDGIEKVDYHHNLNIINYPWDLVNYNPVEIGKDLPFKVAEMNLMDNYEPFSVVIRDVKNVYIDKTVTLKAGVIIDGEDGPVIIDKNAKIMHNSVIIGPAYIGEESLVKIGAKIYEGTSIGKVCKVGGEVEEVIFHSYSNKQHDGFLGHAYIGSWCNFGADTNNSDLKNNYENVRVEIDGKLVDSESQFAGLYMGDHSKTGINTMFNTGTVVGVGCNVYGEGFPPRNIPDFHWGGKGKLVKYPFKRTIETARIVEKRRGIELSEDEFNVLNEIYKTVKSRRK